MGSNVIDVTSQADICREAGIMPNFEKIANTNANDASIPGATLVGVSMTYFTIGRWLIRISLFMRNLPMSLVSGKKQLWRQRSQPLLSCILPSWIPLLPST